MRLCVPVYGIPANWQLWVHMEVARSCHALCRSKCRCKHRRVMCNLDSALVWCDCLSTYSHAFECVSGRDVWLSDCLHGRLPLCLHVCVAAGMNVCLSVCMPDCMRVLVGVDDRLLRPLSIKWWLHILVCLASCACICNYM